MDRWIKHLIQTTNCLVSWECDQCIKDSFEHDLDNTQRSLPGFYQGSKYYGFPDEYVLVDNDRILDGCTTCGFGSPVLQLVIRMPPK